jgi:hypothetical protein
VTHTHVGMGMGVNPYPPVYMSDPVGLFFCREYGYGIVIPDEYLPIAISIRSNTNKHGICNINITPNIGTNHIRIFYTLL